MTEAPASEQTQQEESPERLKAMLKAYSAAKRNAESTKTRLTDLMSRKIAKKWDLDKKQKMTRRYVATGQIIKEATDLIDQITHRLSQITTEARPVSNVAPYVGGPATSV